MIKLQCVCGHKLNLPDHLANQKIRCKQCGKVMRVPDGMTASGRRRAAPGIADVDPSLRIAGSRPCPGCGEVYPPGVVVCVACGLNVDNGAMLYVSGEDQVVPPTLPEAPVPAGVEVSWWRRLVSKLLGR